MKFHRDQEPNMQTFFEEQDSWSSIHQRQLLLTNDTDQG